MKESNLRRKTCMSVHFRGVCKVSMLKQVCRSGPGKCDVQFTCLTFIRKITICCLNASIDAIRWEVAKNKCHLCGLSGNQAMRSFLEALWKHSGNHPQTIFVLFKWGQLTQSFWIVLIWADLDYSISFQKNWQKQLSWRQIKRNCAVPDDCISNEAQTVTPAVQPQKAKHSHSAATIKI